MDWLEELIKHITRQRCNKLTCTNIISCLLTTNFSRISYLDKKKWDPANNTTANIDPPTSLSQCIFSNFLPCLFLSSATVYCALHKTRYYKAYANKTLCTLGSKNMNMSNWRLRFSQMLWFSYILFTIFLASLIPWNIMLSSNCNLFE
jgi:hypothetical protein